ncbi:MAG: PQQ-binding-like beta-propeller repeat protein [Planctomycetes bacterium]|nr:PQQ-binding-like beta-propeller repeat protein [Planctomycetota bacterium]
MLTVNLNYLRWIGGGLFALTMVVASQAGAADRLVGFEAASKNGLERAWFSQVRVDRGKNRVTNWTLHDDLLLALTSTGTVHAMDAESGRTRWVAQVGNPSHPSTGPAANADFVAVLSGSKLFLLDRGDGHLVWSRPIGNTSEAAPALSEKYAYVAQINGRVEGFKLDDPTARIWQYQSVGHIYQPPIITGELVAWASDRGHLYFGNAISPRVAFRVETYDKIVSAPTASGKNLYATSLGGYLYCYTQAKGAELWRYSSGLPITKKPTVVGGVVYVASEAPALHAIDSTSGRHLWTAEGVVQFVARGTDRVYGLNRFGTLLILDGESGTLAGRIATGAGISALANEQSDRIFLVSDSGLVQCLHELGAEKPTFHMEAVGKEMMSEKGKPEDTPAEVEEPAEEDAEEEPFEDGDGDPFGDADPFG